MCIRDSLKTHRKILGILIFLDLFESHHNHFSLIHFDTNQDLKSVKVISAYGILRDIRDLEKIMDLQ